MRNKSQLNSLQRRFYKGPTDIVDTHLDAPTLLVYFFLTTCSETFHPSVRYIAEKVKLNRKTVARSLATLVECNIIRKVTDASRGHTTQYEFVHPTEWRAA